MPYAIPFSTRVKIFREFVAVDQLKRRDQHVDPDAWRAAFGIDNSHISSYHARVGRTRLFEDAFLELWELGDGLKEPIQIEFVDQFGAPEPGVDGGGLLKEFLDCVTQEAFAPTKTADFDMFIENDNRLLHPNPAAVDTQKALMKESGVDEGSPEWNEALRDLLRRYEFLGRIVGKCMYEGILVNVSLAGFFLSKWAFPTLSISDHSSDSRSTLYESGYRASLNELRELDNELYQGLVQLKHELGNVEDYGLTFTIDDPVFMAYSEEARRSAPSTQVITRELRPNGSNIAVTNANRLLYISYVARHKLESQPRLQTNAFLRGLASIINPSWLSMFNPAEIQTLVSGDSAEIDVADLRRHTIYGGVYVIGDDRQEHPTVQYFWKVMKSFSDAERRKVLQFVTSTPRAPLLGFQQLRPQFCIRDSGSQQNRLPSASTCINLLKLPRYSDVKTLREKLLTAVSLNVGFGLS
ncbi:MAG: hypothetical protein M1826_007337 [Phylliscum demangeonii]|nr:MAG: hypothetical protein M1826_007337 [Phylliscum demangeonii]